MTETSTNEKSQTPASLAWALGFLTVGVGILLGRKFDGPDDHGSEPDEALCDEWPGDHGWCIGGLRTVIAAIEDGDGGEQVGEGEGDYVHDLQK